MLSGQRVIYLLCMSISQVVLSAIFNETMKTVPSVSRKQENKLRKLLSACEVRPKRVHRLLLTCCVPSGLTQDSPQTTTVTALPLCTYQYSILTYLLTFPQALLSLLLLLLLLLMMMLMMMMMS